MTICVLYHYISSVCDNRLLRNDMFWMQSVSKMHTKCATNFTQCYYYVFSINIMKEF